MTGPGSDRGTTARDLASLAALAAILFFAGLGLRDLWNPNEPIYGLAVAEMHARGDWLVPTVNGFTFGEKPILYYWLALAAAKVTGSVDEFSLRVPSALFGIAGVVLSYLLVLPYAGRRRATVAGVAFATTYMVWWGARSVQMDILVAVTTLAAIVPATRALDHGGRPWACWTLAGAAAGIAFLAKGPVGWICPAAALGIYLLSTGRWREMFRPHVLAAGAVAIAVAAPWYLMLWGHGRTDVIEEVLIRQNFTRFRNAWDHVAPWWYYLEYFWIDLAPWSWMVPVAALARGRNEDEKKLDRLAWCWIVGIVIFFSLSQSKRSPYILPIAGAVAALASGPALAFLDGTLAAGRRRAVVVLAAVWGTVLAAGGAFGFVKVAARVPEIAGPARVFCAVAAAGGLGILAALVAGRGRGRALGAAFVGAVAALFLAAGLAVLPAADVFKSARGFCDATAAQVEPGDRVASFNFWRWRSQYAFYLRRAIPNLDDEAALREAWQRPGRLLLIVEQDRLEGARRVIGDARPLVDRPMGEGHAYLFASR